MAERKENLNLDDILGVGGDFVTPADLMGQEFEITGIAGTEAVIGYDEPAMRLNIIFNEQPTTWSTFSDVIKQQVADIIRLNLLPVRVSLKEVPSKTRRGKSYLRLIAPKG